MSINPHYLALAASILLTVLSQLLLKIGAGRERGAVNLITLISLACFGLVTILIVYALQAIELKTLIAFNALVFVAMPLSAKYFLKETITTRQFVGSLVILAGILAFLSAG